QRLAGGDAQLGAAEIADELENSLVHLIACARPSSVGGFGSSHCRAHRGVVPTGSTCAWGAHLGVVSTLSTCAWGAHQGVVSTLSTCAWGAHRGVVSTLSTCA